MNEANTVAGTFKSRIVETREYRELGRIREPDVVAVIYQPAALPSWRSLLAEAVEDGSLQIPRVSWNGVTKEEFGERLKELLASDSIAEFRDPLRTEILAMVDGLAEITGSRHFMLRIFTESPSTQCGFHVDTVSPGACPWGFLQVFNGAGTEYIHPDDISDPNGFYRYLGARDDLSRKRREAAEEGYRKEAIEREIAKLDSDLSFVRSGRRFRTAPAGSIVAFKHVDLQDHWQKGANAWIHCSPMCGSRRLVLNIAPTDRRPLGARAARHGKSP